MSRKKPKKREVAKTEEVVSTDLPKPEDFKGDITYPEEEAIIEEVATPEPKEEPKLQSMETTVYCLTCEKMEKAISLTIDYKGCWTYKLACGHLAIKDFGK